MISVAIDGPAGAGKSTVAREAAQRLGYVYVDTGAMYRAIGLYICRLGKRTDVKQDVLPYLKDIKIEIKYIKGEGQRIYLNGEDVSEKIREPEISMAASNVSAMGEVRDFLFELQRSTARENNVVMDGRDIGTVVLPNAQVKIFLTAQLEERARRRWIEMKNKGQEADFNEVLEDVRQRDYNDTNRKVAPLKQADDAVLVDTTGYDFEQSVQLVMDTVEGRLKNVL
ncbi:MAG: (d)CMP kinase [Oscillospiraceae bacterium]|nr:(d)CMP kinase [Oscillospiraceae bacterium]